MSLIHEALKKAEQESQSSLNKQPHLTNPIVKVQKIPILTLLLVTVLGLSLVFLVYMRLVRRPQNIPTPAPIQPTGAFNTEQNPTALKQTALRLFEEKKYEASLAAWEKLTLLLPTEAQVYNNLGLVLKKLGRLEEAFQAYTKALALKEDYPEALNNLGTLYLLEGQRGPAKQNFQKAVQLTPEYADPYFHLGLIAEQEGNKRLAIQHYEHFLKQSTRLDETLKNRLEKKMELLSR